MLTQKDKDEIVGLGIDLSNAEKQIKQFEEGFPFLKLIEAATIGNGIIAVGEPEKQALISAYESWNGKRVKFVPASGAATRMFKSLYEAKSELEGGDTLDKVTAAHKDVRQVFEHIDKFAFYPQLNQRLAKTNYTPMTKEWAIEVLSLILGENGLNYGNLPKGLIKFHNYANETRTAAIEHLVEGAEYAAGKGGEVNLHFTVSPNHIELFKAEIESASKGLEKQYNVKYNVSFSTQKKSTDTIAVDMSNTPFRDAKGNLVFRPAGHGALLENLNEIDGDIIFIKNIDNVVPDRIKGETITYKKLIAGLLIQVQGKAFELLRRLEAEEMTPALKNEIESFIKQIGAEMPEQIDKASAINLLNRPIRVCGMVKNQGEPGGGPFFAPNANGEKSLQIVESSQVDTSDAKQKSIFSTSTHFNPVDLVCAVKNYKGEKFDLLKYRDEKAGFISKKSKDGKDLKAMELPGLWNGAMSNWLTLFVEVPLITFNPVKTINDLLKEEHQ